MKDKCSIPEVFYSSHCFYFSDYVFMLTYLSSHVIYCWHFVALYFVVAYFTFLFTSRLKVYIQTIKSLRVCLLGPRIIVDSGYYIPYQKGIPTVEIIIVIGQSWVQVSFSKKLYPHCLVLVGSRNVFDRDFRSKKSH